MWKYSCAICGKTITEDYSLEEVKEAVGATHNCPECNGLLLIQDDLTVIDFGNVLVNSYKEVGIEVDKETAVNSFVEY